jgi:hypothetical protein
VIGEREFTTDYTDSHRFCNDWHVEARHATSPHRRRYRINTDSHWCPVKTPLFWGEEQLKRMKINAIKLYFPILLFLVFWVILSPP